MNYDQAKALFILSGFDIKRISETDNLYWGENHTKGPWWLVETQIGTFCIGWRKRVIAIEWINTSIRKVITEDNVTKSEVGVHAYSYGKALEYLDSLRYEATKSLHHI